MASMPQLDLYGIPEVRKGKKINSTIEFVQFVCSF